MKTKELTKPENTPVTNEALALPSDYWQSDNQEGSNDESASYVGFYHKKSGEKTKAGMEAAGGRLDQFYLFHKGTYIPLPKLTYHLLESYKCYTKEDNRGNPLAVFEDDPGNPKEFQQTGLAVIAVKHGNSLVPASFKGRGGLYNALKAARTMQTTANKKAEFEALGEQYKIAAQSPVVQSRFVATASASMEKNPDTGNDFTKANCSTSPSRVEDINLFLAATKDPEFNAQLAKVRGRYKKQVDTLKSKIGKS